MDNLTISDIKARQVLDSRGNPTVEADVYLSSGQVGRAAVPSGASTGEKEAIELRDGDDRYYSGKSVQKAVWNVNSKIRDILVGNTANQKTVDQMMIDLDGSDNKANLGANAILAVSLANAKAVAKARHVHFYEHIADLAGTNDQMSIPLPMMNVMNGGAHADWSTDFQEYMIMPLSAQSISDAVRMGAEIFHILGKILKEQNFPITVGDEGGYAPKINAGDDNKPLELIKEAVERSRYNLGSDIGIALDIAASEFAVKPERAKGEGATLEVDLPPDHYELKTNGDWKTADDLINWYSWILDHYPVVSIEDGLGETDWAGWREMTERLGEKTQLVGDDLFVTNVDILEKGITDNVGNAILIKPNQIGTLSETIKATMTAKDAGYRTIISHRSGETEDTSIAHLAVGLGTGQIKTGSLSRSERIAKYNELIRIADTNSHLGLTHPF